MTKKLDLADARIPIILGVAGHRDLRNEDIPILEQKVRDIFLKIHNDYPHSPILLLSPLAEGADRLVARVALNLNRGIKLIAPIPMPIEEYKKDFKSPESLSEFKELLALTEKYFELPLVERNTLENIREHGTNRDEQYVQVGAYIAKHSHILIALWDGVEPKLIGGTAQAVYFKLGRIIEPYAPPLKYLDIVDSGPVYHIVTPRISNPYPQGNSFDLHQLYPETNYPLAKIYKNILKKIDNYNFDISSLIPKIMDKVVKSRDEVLSAEKSKKLSVLSNNILDYYSVADVLALYFQKKSKLALGGLLVLALVAFFFFQIYLEFVRSPFVLLLYPVTLSIAYFWYFMAKRRNYQDKYLDYRAIAEGLRVQLFWEIAGFRDDVAEYYLRKQKSELDWIRYAIRAYNNSVEKLNNEETIGSDKISDCNIILKHWVNNQRDYFIEVTKRDNERLQRNENYSNLFYWFGLGIAVVMLIIHNYLYHVEILHHIIIVSIVMSIAIAAAIQGYIEKASFAEHSKQYMRMRELFTHASKHLAAFIKNDDIKNAQDIIRELGIEALMENADWVLLHRAKSIEVPKG